MMRILLAEILYIFSKMIWRKLDNVLYRKGVGEKRYIFWKNSLN